MNVVVYDKTLCTRQGITSMCVLNDSIVYGMSGYRDGLGCVCMYDDEHHTLLLGNDDMLKLGISVVVCDKNIYVAHSTGIIVGLLVDNELIIKKNITSSIKSLVSSMCIYKSDLYIGSSYNNSLYKLNNDKLTKVCHSSIKNEKFGYLICSCSSKLYVSSIGCNKHRIYIGSDNCGVFSWTFISDYNIGYSMCIFNDILISSIPINNGKINIMNDNDCKLVYEGCNNEMLGIIMICNNQYIYCMNIHGQVYRLIPASYL